MNMIFLLTCADMMEDTEADFYVIENFPDPHFVTDENGDTKCFRNYHKALLEASDCQNGYVIVLPA